MKYSWCLKVKLAGAILLTISLQQLVSCQQCESTGIIGCTGNTAPGDNRAQDAFYINRGQPASCDGNITSFSYCYHPPDNVNNNDDYVATFAVYRSQAGSSNSSTAFEVVSQTLILQFRGRNLASEFTCSELTADPPVPVEAGDVVGACVFNPRGGNLERLDLVSSTSEGNTNLLRSGNPETAGCTTTVVPSSFTTLIESNSQALHLWANIEPIPETTVSPITTELTTLGPMTPKLTTLELTTPESTTQELPTTTFEATTMEPGSTTREQTTTEPVIVSESDVSITTTEPEATSDVTTEAAELSGDNNNTTIVAIAVVVSLIAVVAFAIILVIVIIVLSRRRRGTIKSYPVATNALDNQIYSAVQEAESQNKPISQEHVYEFEGSSSNFNRSIEDTYAEVGPLGGTNVDEGVYTSPLDVPAVSYAKLLEKNREEDIYGSENPYESPATLERDIYAQLNTWGVKHLEKEEFEIVDHLGSGQFGSVDQGVWKRQGTKPVDVALKSLTKTSEEDKVKFLQEAAIMAQFKHPNVILLHGVIIRGNPMMLVVDLAKKGDLHQYLLSLRPDPGELMPSSTSKSFLKFSQQVALGMQYLSAKGFVHRDLAARNVFITSTNVCKVADFGLSRDLADENYYISHGKDKIPVKWTAPEAIHYKKYSTASDVWSYGCLLYEIWSVGHKPWEEIAIQEAIRVVDSGKRLPPPPGCPKMIYELMIQCWHPETSQRLTFRDIVLTLVSSEEVVLSIPEEDSSTNPLAGVLGAPLEAGENMYSQLQRRYTDYDGTRIETDEDYFEVY